MHKYLLAAFLVLSANGAFAEPKTETCGGCETLNEFGIAGARYLWDESDGWGWSLLDDKVWVTNEITGVSAFVDLDMAYTVIWILNIEVRIPNAMETTIKVSFADASGTTKFTVANDLLVRGLFPSGAVRVMGEGASDGEDGDDSTYEEDEWDEFDFEFDFDEDDEPGYRTGVEEGEVNEDGEWEEDTIWVEEL